MTTVFTLGSYLVLPFWLLAIIAPRWEPTRRLMRSPFIAIGPAVLYAMLAVPRAVEILPIVARPELPAVAALLGTEMGATIAWQHFLAFDLLVGRWIYLDALDRGVSSWLLRLVLPLTLLVGPIGWLAYLAARTGSAPPRPAVR